LQPNIFWQLCKYGSLLLLDVAKSCRWKNGGEISFDFFL
jgi:hypothetical protein